MLRGAMLCSLLLLPAIVGCASAPDSENQGRQPPTCAQRLVWFFPDRGMDLLDVVSLEISAGYGLGVKRRVTDWLHVPTLSAYRAWNLFSWNYGRRFAWFSENEEYAAGLLPLYWYRSEFRGRGAGNQSFHASPVARLGDEIYKTGRGDPWAIGGYYGPPLLGPRIAIDLHPVEIADFVAGLLTVGFIDICNDDWPGS